MVQVVRPAPKLFKWTVEKYILVKKVNNVVKDDNLKSKWNKKQAIKWNIPGAENTICIPDYSYRLVILARIICENYITGIATISMTIVIYCDTGT